MTLTVHAAQGGLFERDINVTRTKVGTCTLVTINRHFNRIGLDAFVGRRFASETFDPFSIFGR